MSEIKVDTIGPRVDNGTLTIGASGDTVNIAGTAGTGFPAGTTLTGSTNNTVATVTGANALAGETNFIYNGTIVGAGADGANADLGVGIHVKVSDTGATVNSGADALVLEDNGGDMGMTILSSTSGQGRIEFGDSGNNAMGGVKYDHGDNSMRIYTNNGEKLRISSQGVATLTGNGSSSTEELLVLTNGTSGNPSYANLVFKTAGNTSGCWIKGVQASGGNDGRLQFHTNNSGTVSERMRILYDGTVTISTSGSIPSNLAGLHVNRGNGQNGGIIRGHSESTSYDSTLLTLTCARDAEGNEFNFFIGKNNNNDDKIIIRNDGDIQNVNNSYGAISDERFKQNITEASSQWDDIKALKIRNFQTKQEPTLTQLGVVAQEVEASGMNGLIDEVPPTESYVQYSSDFGTLEDDTTKPILDEDGNETGAYEQIFTKGQNIKAVKYSVLYMKSIKALQEAMEKIETLEAKVTALENA